MNVFKNAPLPDLKNRLILSQGKLPTGSSSQNFSVSGYLFRRVIHA